MEDIENQELAAIIRNIQDSDVTIELAKEISQRQASEKLLVMMLDRILQLEVRLRQHELSHHYTS